MSRKHLSLLSLIVLFLLLPSQYLGQVNSSMSYNSKSFRDFDFGTFSAGSRNFVEIGYGLAELKHENIQTEFSPLSISEIKIGRRFVKPAAGYKIIEFNDNYLFSSFVDFHNSDNSSEALDINYESWRFGLGYRKGYGYNFSSIGLFPHYQFGLVWNRTQMTHPFERIRVFDGNDYSNEINIVSHYHEEIKFGTTSIGGIDLRLGSLIGIGASYETAIIFPYHKFWKQVGSFFIETFAQTGIDFLAEGVLIKYVPGITPILYFVLKNGLSYYLYTLKQEEMNWPFETTAPLSLEAIKFSVKISF